MDERKFVSFEFKMRFESNSYIDTAPRGPFY